MRVVATIPVGTRPIGVAAGFDHIFVTNGDDDSLSVIDAKTNTPINTVKVGACPAGVATDPQGGVFVANSGDGTVSLLNREHALQDTVTVQSNPVTGVTPRPVGVANNHGQSRVYVINRDDGSVAMINAGVLQPGFAPFFIDLGGDPVSGAGRGPHGVAAAAGPLGQILFVTNGDTNSVLMVDTSAGSILAGFPVRQRPVGLGTDPRGRRVYVAHAKFETVSVIETQTGKVTDIDVGKKSLGVALDPDRSQVWVTHDDGTVTLISTTDNTVTATVEIGSRPEGVAIDPRSGCAYVANSGEGTVSVVSPADR